MLTTTNKDFEIYLESFQEIDLPITLTQDLSPTFSAENRPLKDEQIVEFIHPVDSEIDEYTEYVPCFRLKETPHFKATVYWKASLTVNQYVLVIYTLLGEPLSARVLSSVEFEEKGQIIRSIASIEDDWTIVIAKGAENQGAFDVNSNKVVTLEIMPDGTIQRGQ